VKEGGLKMNESEQEGNHRAKRKKKIFLSLRESQFVIERRNLFLIEL